MGQSKLSINCIMIILSTLLLVVCLAELEADASDPPEKSWSAKTCIHLRSIDNNSSSSNPLVSSAHFGLSPDIVRKAYNLPSTGSNVTIAIIDAYDYPTARK